MQVAVSRIINKQPFLFMKIVSKATINRPVKEVWDFFDNVDNLGKWLKDFFQI